MPMVYGTMDGYLHIISKLGNGIVKFYDADEITEVNFPDKEIRLVKKYASCLFTTMINNPFYP